jgi:hypothetical protein
MPEQRACSESEPCFETARVSKPASQRERDGAKAPARPTSFRENTSENNYLEGFRLSPFRRCFFRYQKIIYIIFFRDFIPIFNSPFHGLRFQIFDGERRISRMKKPLWLCHVLLPFFLLPGCGKAIKTAQDYTVNRPPVIVSMTVVNSDKSGKVVPFSSYPVTVTATDPDAGQTLTYSFSSSGTGGSFAGQTSVTGGYSATFVAGDLAANQTVYVYVKVTDGHGGYATSSVNVGTAKNGPAISVSTDKTAIKPADALTLNAFANCDGVFQI